MMTSTPFGSEEPCFFGSVKENVRTCIYTFQADSPTMDIVIHANDAKLAFCQIKIHPDILGAFSYSIADKLFLTCGQPFGTDLCPTNQEVIHQVLEELATTLFANTSLYD